jgi:hypothetical protein
VSYILAGSQTGIYSSVTNSSGGYYYLITNTAASGFQVPVNPADGFYVIVRNMPSSVGALTVQTTTGTTIVALAPAVTSTILFQRSGATYYYL